MAFSGSRKEKDFREGDVVWTHNKMLATMEFTSNRASVGNSRISRFPLRREETVTKGAERDSLHGSHGTREPRQAQKERKDNGEMAEHI